jgi:hypothetical protein
MKLNLHINKLASPLHVLLSDNNLGSTEERTKKYKTLLHNIAVSLGLDENESSELVEWVCLNGSRNYDYQSKNFTLKIWLSKILVRNCVFKINSRMFSQNESCSFQTENNFLISLHVQKIPFSLMVVYILLHNFGFTEKEAAQILNITPMHVKERFAKAMFIIKCH